MSDLQAGIELGRTLERMERELSELRVSTVANERIALLEEQIQELRGRVFVAEETVAEVAEEVAEEIADESGDGEGDTADANVDINIENVVEAVDDALEAVDDALEAVSDAVEEAGETVEETVETALESAPADDSAPERSHLLDRPIFGRRG